MDEIEMQTVWRTMNETAGCGYFVWDVIEVIGEPSAMVENYYTVAADGTYFMYQCYHFWTKEKATGFMKDSVWSKYQTVIYI